MRHHYKIKINFLKNRSKTRQPPRGNLMGAYERSFNPSIFKMLPTENIGSCEKKGSSNWMKAHY